MQQTGPSPLIVRDDTKKLSARNFCLGCIALILVALGAWYYYDGGTSKPYSLGKSIDSFVREVPFLQEAAPVRDKHPIDGEPRCKWVFPGPCSVFFYGPENNVTRIIITAPFPNDPAPRLKSLAFVTKVAATATGADVSDLDQWIVQHAQDGGSRDFESVKLEMVSLPSQDGFAATFILRNRNTKD